MSYWRGRTAIVTGASSGLGKAIAQELATRGANVALLARGAAALETAANELQFDGGAALTIATDVTRQEDVERAIALTVERFGQIDALVNNAGSSQRRAILDTTPEDFQALWDLNFLSVVRCVRAAAPHLIARCGHVVNIGSLAGKVGARYVGAYSASKFPVTAYSQQLRLELGPAGLHVLLVCPGPVARDEPRSTATVSGQTDRDSEEDLEKLPESARRPGAGAKTSLIRPESLASNILLACERRQPELVVPGKAKLLFALSQLFPALGDSILKKMT